MCDCKLLRLSQQFLNILNIIYFSNSLCNMMAGFQPPSDAAEMFDFYFGIPLKDYSELHLFRTKVVGTILLTPRI